MSDFENLKFFESLCFEIFYVKMEVLVVYWTPSKKRCVLIDDLPCWQAFIVSTKITKKTPHGDPLYMLFTACTSNVNYISNCHLRQCKAIPFFTQCAMWYFCLICESAANFRMHSSINFPCVVPLIPYHWCTLCLFPFDMYFCFHWDVISAQWYLFNI